MQAFRIHADDNVATLLGDVVPGPVQIGGEGDLHSIAVLEEIQLGHKVALQDIAAGTPIRKFGTTIGEATRAIRAGEWVHLHNCKSRYDARSETLDLHSGATTDMSYE